MNAAVAEPTVGPSLSLDGVRILCVMPAIPLYGMERATIRIMGELRNAGAAVRFVTVAEDYGASVREAVAKAGCESSTVSITRNIGRPRSVSDAISLWRHWRDVRFRVQVIEKEFQPTHIHIANLTFFYYALPPRQKRQRRVVFRVPNPPVTPPVPWRGRIHRLIWRRVVAPRTDLFVCNSAYTADLLRWLVGKSADIRLIPNSVVPREQPTAQRISERSDRINIVYIGQISTGKGVHLLMDVAVRLIKKRTDLEFWIAGENSWQNELGNQLVARARTEGRGRIHFLGPIDDVFELFGQAHIHLCPSVNPDSSPNVVLEAKQTGVPTIAFNTGGLPELIRDGVEGWVCHENDSGSLESAIEKLADDPALRIRLGNAARVSLERYDHRTISAMWKSLYSERWR